MICFFAGRHFRFVIFILLLLISVVVPVKCPASFSVIADTFSISNSPGYCFAMAAFSRWYYLRNSEEPRLRQVFDKSAQQLIARELQTFYSKHLIGVQAEYCNRYNGERTESFRRFISGLATGEPRIVLLMNKGSRGAVLHAVLAYAWYPEQNVIKIYDPNYCNEERFVDLDKREYTSLDITYTSICFPEILQSHPALLAKMENLFKYHAERRRYANGWRNSAASSSSKRRQNPKETPAVTPDKK